MSNAFVALVNLLPKYPLQIGTVSSVTNSVVDVDLPGGNSVRVRGTASVGDTVFVRNGLIEGPAPALTPVEIEV
jgi:hypothetical protein